MKRYLLLVMLCVCVSIGAWAINIQGNGGTYEVSDGVATFNVTNPGAIAQHWTNNIVGNLPDGTRIVFTSGSKINEADLTTILQSGTNNKRFYIDLFDIVGDGGPTLAQVDEWISNGVAAMKSNYQSQYGIILPYNSSLGTMAVEKPNGNEYNNVATFTQYVAYYRDTNDTNNLVLHIFDSFYYVQDTSSYVYGGNAPKEYYSTAAQHLNTHTQIKAAHSVLVSTITNIQFDLSKFKASKVKIEITHDDVIGGHKNPAIPDKANIYVNSEEEDGFNEHVSTTGTKSTPTDILKISGSVTTNDVLAVNLFTAGPRVLDLRNANVDGGITKTLLESITNSHIEYILLPEGMSKDVVCGANYQLANLKAVISSSDTNLVAHVAQAGSLAEARSLVTGGSVTTPTTVGLTSVTLSGNLNASDLASNVNQQSKINVADGHLYSKAIFAINQNTSKTATDYGYTSPDGITEGASGLSGESSITTLDLRDAVFSNNRDMNFNLLGLSSLVNVSLPISDQMTEIPIGCFSNEQSLDYICIPCNYTDIRPYAFGLSAVTCITTDNANHTLVVGKTGETYLNDSDAKAALNNTFTFSPNLASIGTGAFQTTQEVLTDIYVMATTTPLCEKDAFSGPTYYGNNGFRGAGYPYCRDKYYNNGKLITLLHYPAGDITNADYQLMEKQYTDIYKIYTKKEQTGAVDGNGRSILWPTQSEMTRAFLQASEGSSWHDWKTGYDTNKEVNTSTSLNGFTEDTTQPIGLHDFDFTGYEGWHQFALAMADFYENTNKIIENEKIVRNYVDAGWFTFCIPFDMTHKEVIELMGVPASDDTYTNKYKGQDVGSQWKMPDIRQLASVTRKKADANNKRNTVTFTLTNNLNEGLVTNFLDFNVDAELPSKVISETKAESRTSGLSDPLDAFCLRGGRPYIIKAYKLEGETIAKRNLGQYVMDKHGNDFDYKASCLYRDIYEYLGDASDSPKKTTLKFAKPFENNKVQAVPDTPNPTDEQYLTYKDENGKTQRYYYTLVGQFWEQKLPKYCIYMSGNKWYRNSTDNDYKWSPYKCVIMATPIDETDTHPQSGKYRDNSGSATASFYPTIDGVDLVNGDLKLVFKDGRDDDDFDTAPYPTAAKYCFVLAEDIMEFDDQGNDITAIDTLDGMDFSSLSGTGRVYNMAGQYVGSSLEGLGKGMYIVDGKKFVVK